MMMLCFIIQLFIFSVQCNNHSKLKKAEEYESNAGREPYVEGYDVGHVGQRRLVLLRDDGQKAGHSKGDSSRHSVGRDPECEHGHDNNEDCGNINVDEVEACSSIHQNCQLQGREIS